MHRLPDVAELLLDLSHCLEIGCTVEGVTTHKQKLDQISRDVAASDVEPSREMGERKAIIYRYDVRHAVARVDHDARRQACTCDKCEKTKDEKGAQTYLAHKA